MKSRLLLDGMLGRLCRKMRLLGYDARLAVPGESPRLLLDAALEGRVAVTASTRSSDRPGPEPIVLRGAGLAARTAELFAALRERTGELPQIEPFTRCLECNIVLEEVPSPSVAGSVPERVRARCDRYVRCPSCGRIYWEGSHWEAMRDQVERLAARLRAEGLLEGGPASGDEGPRDVS
jgi:hypothetical protein